MEHNEKQPRGTVGGSFDDYARRFEAGLDPRSRRAAQRLGDQYSLAVDLLQLRKQKGMTQVELAKVSGVHQSEISRIENGSANPSQETLEAIGAALGLRLGFVPVAEIRWLSREDLVPLCVPLLTGGNRRFLADAVGRSEYKTP